MWPESKEPGSSRAVYWTTVFLVNLIVPLPLGLFVTSEGGGALGMTTAIILFWAVGLILSYFPGRLADVLNSGGLIVAITQLVPLLQLISGCIAIFTCESILGSSVLNGDRLESEVFGFLITLMTAFPLLLAAFVLGGGHRLLYQNPVEEDEGDDIDEGEDEPIDPPVPRLDDVPTRPDRPRFRPHRLPPSQ